MINNEMLYCGTVRNCGNIYLLVFGIMKKISTLFEDYVIILYYDNSDDNTLAQLQAYQKNNTKFILWILTKINC